ncbi:MAG TPA: hypothetical protein VGL45_14420 [Bradyrhizobium sp.]
MISQLVRTGSTGHGFCSMIAAAMLRESAALVFEAGIVPVGQPKNEPSGREPKCRDDRNGRPVRVSAAAQIGPDGVEAENIEKRRAAQDNKTSDEQCGQPIGHTDLRGWARRPCPVLVANPAARFEGAPVNAFCCTLCCA